MQPGTERRPTDPPDTDAGEFNAWRALQVATDDDRAAVIADIVGHPTMASVEEIDYMNPSMSEHAIRRHLDRLETADVITTHELEPGERLREFPYQFYTVTTVARELFDQTDLFSVDAWQRQYQAVEKTQRIQEIETMPRPD
jgi:hypothetical protein